MKRKIRVFTIEFMYLLAALILAAVLAFFVSTLVGLIVAGVGIVVIAVFILFSMLRRIKWQKIVLKTLRENNDLNIYLNTMIIK